MNREEFIKRVIVLTNEKDNLQKDHQELINISYSCSFSNEIKKDLVKRISSTEMAIKHCSDNIRLNRSMADRYDN